MFVPGTKHQPEARVIVMIAGITFESKIGPSKYVPSYVFRFNEPIPYHFIEEEGQKPHNWLPPIFKQASRRGKIETTFMRLEYAVKSKTTTQLVFNYYDDDRSDEREEQLTKYVQCTSELLRKQSGANQESDVWPPVTLQIITNGVQFGFQSFYKSPRSLKRPLNLLDVKNCRP